MGVQKTIPIKHDYIIHNSTSITGYPHTFSFNSKKTRTFLFLCFYELYLVTIDFNANVIKQACIGNLGATRGLVFSIANASTGTVQIDGEASLYGGYTVVFV